MNPPPPDHPAAPFGTVLSRNIETLIRLRKEAARQKSRQDRVADAITRFSGSMAFVYLHLAFFGAWIGVNGPWAPAGLRFDPTFVILAMEASVEAIFLSTFVLISQNRSTIDSDKRAELDLQISLLAEHEITQAVKLLDAIAHRLGIDPAREAGANPQSVADSKHEVDPAQVFQAIEQRRRESGEGG